MTIEDFIDKLSSTSDSDRLIHNPYCSETCKDNLANYLHHLSTVSIDVMLVGEAPGYRGCALTGIPFTDEIQLTMPENYYALGNWKRSDNCGITKERTASEIWLCIRNHNIIPLMWNVFPFHPYKGGAEASNRTPTSDELREGFEYVTDLKTIFGIDESHIFAIGRKAQVLLNIADPDHYIRHPANDCKREFRSQFNSRIMYNNTENLY